MNFPGSREASLPNRMRATKFYSLNEPPAYTPLFASLSDSRRTSLVAFCVCLCENMYLGWGPDTTMIRFFSDAATAFPTTSSSLNFSIMRTKVPKWAKISSPSLSGVRLFVWMFNSIYIHNGLLCSNLMQRRSSGARDYSTVAFIFGYWVMGDVMVMEKRDSAEK